MDGPSNLMCSLRKLSSVLKSEATIQMINI